MLEETQHPPGNCIFVTLTYSELYLPRISSVSTGTLIPRDLQKFLKRFRKAMEPSKIRFFACGEYGDETERPHYHLAMFNVPQCRYHRSHFRRSSKGETCCDVCDRIRDTWGYGRVQVDDFNSGTAAYVAGYVTKKMTAPDDTRLNGRHPEFARMSNRPGIGHDAMEELSATLLKLDLDQLQGDVPVTLAHGTRELPLGRYLRRKLRKLMGKDENTPQEILDQMAETMRPLREAAFDASTSFKKKILDHYAGDRASFAARQKIFKGKKRTL